MVPSGETATGAVGLDLIVGFEDIWWDVAVAVELENSAAAALDLGSLCPWGIDEDREQQWFEGRTRAAMVGRMDKDGEQRWSDGRRKKTAIRMMEEATRAAMGGGITKKANSNS